MRVCPHCEQKTTEKLCPTDGYQTVDAAAYEADKVDPFLGKEFEGRYRIEKMLGQGGFGAVYKATQLAVNRAVALKIMKSELATDLKEVARFQQEARALASLKNPYIVSLIDFGQADGGHLYLVMDFCNGKPMNAMLKDQGKMVASRVVTLGLQILDGLAEAHALGIVHRDLKPENLFLVTDRRGNESIRILDFGIAKVSGDAAANVTLTAAGIAIGSPRYMSPEQARGKAVTPQTDLYSFGVILYEMLTGHSVFQCETATDYLMAHVRDAPPNPVVNGIEVGGPLVQFILKCLAKNTADRPASADDAARLLKACEGGPLDTSIALPASAPAAAATAASTAMLTGEEATAYSDASGINEAAEQYESAAAQAVAPPMADPSAATAYAPATPHAAAAPSAVPTGTPNRIPSGQLPQVSHDPTGRAGLLQHPTGHGPAMPTHQYGATQTSSVAMVVASVAIVVAALIVAGALMWTKGGDDKAEEAVSQVEGDQKGEATGDDPKAGVKVQDEAKDEAKAKDEQPVASSVFGVRVDSDPGGAEVKVGGETIGTAPMDVTWKKGERPPKLFLRVKARGALYTGRVKLTKADAGTSKTVKLKKFKSSPAASGGKSGGGKSGGGAGGGGNVYEVID